MVNNRFNDIFSFSHEPGQLEKIAEKYPWCSIAHLALLHSYQKNNSAQLEKQAEKTALFFNNTKWLNWQLYRISLDEQHKELPAEEVEESHAQHDQKIGKIGQSLSGISAQANTTATTIEFEPLHTTDYFASQGIKLSDEPVSNDKLGTQLKSFTDWLKSMKKLHKEKLAEGDEQTDKTIQQIAEHSNAEAEVITEAMAEVLIRQQKHDKAIEVYNKLSLLNPSKSAYFAAKIDSLSKGGQI